MRVTTLMVKLVDATWAVATIILVLAACLTNAQNEPKITVHESIVGLQQIVMLKNSPVVFVVDSTGLKISTNRGQSWDQVKEASTILGNGAFINSVVAHPHQPVAHVLTSGTKHLRYADGKWTEFTTPGPLEDAIVEYHAIDPKRAIIYVSEDCSPFGICSRAAYVTIDGFEKIERMLPRVIICRFARSQLAMTMASDKLVFCVAPKPNTFPKSPRDWNLLSSDSYFSDQKQIVVNFNGAIDPRSGVVGILGLEKYLIAAVMPPGDADLDLFVSLDGQNWAMARFPLEGGVRENAYTMLESAPYSLVVDVLTSRDTGTIYRSNSNGTFFTASLVNSHRNSRGSTDFERADWMASVMLANQQLKGGQVVSRISWDEGSHWQPLKPPEKDAKGNTYSCNRNEPEKCSLHLHSTTSSTSVIGKIFSEASVPGAIIGVGNVGGWLLDYNQGDVFLSMDGGVSWKCIAEGAHHYRWLDSGTVLVLVDNEGRTNQIGYSFDFGGTFQKFNLPSNMRVRTLMNDAQSLSPSLLVIGTRHGQGQQQGPILLHIDFAPVFGNSKCTDQVNYETWELDVQGKCVMGQTRSFRRIKANAKCLAGRDKVPTPESHACNCEPDDFECDTDFLPGPPGQDGEPTCLLQEGATDPLRPAKCSGTYTGSSGYRKIPGNMCQGGVDKTKSIMRDCPAVVSTAISGLDAPVTSSIVVDPLVMMLRLDTGNTMRSTDGGITWKQSIEGVALLAQHEHDPRFVLAVAPNSLRTSADGGTNWNTVQTPVPPNLLGKRIFDFHPDKHDWMIFVGSAVECPNGPACHTKAYASKDNGANWKLIDTYVEKCLFARDVEFRSVDEDVIYCLSYQTKSGSQTLPINNGVQELVAISGFDSSKKVVLASRVVDFFVLHGYLLVAVEENHQLSIKVSLDGKTLTQIQFPADTQLDRRIFTALKSSPHRLFLDVLVSGIPNHEFGTAFASNENGTSYTPSLNNTNRGGPAGSLVDFYRPQPQVAPGVVIANTVVNAKNVLEGVVAKRIQTVISLNDGGIWAPLALAEKDDSQRLNLFGSASFFDWHPIVSAKNAQGILVAIGAETNLEGVLPSDSSLANTYISENGGRSWKFAAKGIHSAAILDNGGIIVLIPANRASQILYSWDFGNTWHTQALPTLFSFSSIVWNQDGTGETVVLAGIKIADRSPAVITIDFSHYAPECKKENDFEIWSTSHVKCSLGKKYEFLRRKSNIKCLIKQYPKHDPPTCECSLDDFECDAGFFLNSISNAKTCVRIGDDPNRPKNCPNGTVYETQSGYRKILASKCEGGTTWAARIKKYCGLDDNLPVQPIEHREIPLGYKQLIYTSHGTVYNHDPKGMLWLSSDEGKTWKSTPVLSGVDAVFTHPNGNDTYVFQQGTVKYSRNESHSFKQINLPAQINYDIPMPISFHIEEADWLLFTGKDCPPNRPSCPSTTFYTKNGGTDWHTLFSGDARCHWARTKDFTLVARTGIFCLVKDLLLYSEDFFTTHKVSVFNNVIDTTLSGEFLVAAIKDVMTNTISLGISIDGVHSARAKFPGGIEAIRDGYTVLPSHRGQLLVDTSSTGTTGTLFRSNMNGTLFTKMIGETRRNERGFVDYERIQGITGFVILNTGSGRNIRTAMTRDDGATWVPLRAPKEDSRGDKQPCDSNDLDKCSLHLHSYTERRDPQNVFDVKSAPGLFLGVGNVGSSLDDYKNGNLYITRDGGETWREVAKGAMQYEFGDHGGLLVAVNDETPTKEILYSVDEGHSWGHLQLYGDDQSAVRFTGITTRPDATSQQFILIGTRVSDSIPILHFVDFSTIGQPTCVFDKMNPEKSDFEAWSLPSSQTNNGCLFGKKTIYYRRKAGKACAMKQHHVLTHVEETPCECTRRDFECDFDARLDSNGNCVLTTPPPPCDGHSYSIPSGYRKHPLSACIGGDDLSKPKQYQCSAGLSGWSIAAISLFLPLSLVGGGWLFLFWKRNGHLPTGLGSFRFPEITTPTWLERLLDRVRYSRLGATPTQLPRSTSLLDED